MTLHQAIEKLLKEKGRAMSTSEIANELNINKWYKKRDGSEISAFQIHGRTRNYSHIFDRDASMVSLVEGSKASTSSTSNNSFFSTKKAVPIINSIQINDVEDKLMDFDQFKSPNSIENSVPTMPGLYCIRISDKVILPKHFKEVLTNRNHDILYIGIASQSLNRRFLGQELRARGHGTFFRSLGAMLGYLPPKGSLKNKKNKRNYKFSPKDEQAIIKWINDNLIVNWVAYNGNFEQVESSLIIKYLPLMNLAKNPRASQTLSELRAECVRVAKN